MKNKNEINYKLYLVSDKDMLKDKDLIESLEEAILGGITILQLREKDDSTLDFYEEAIKVKQLTKKYNIPYIINDRLDIALAVDSDGVHLGQGDMPLNIARRLLGPDKIIGVSAHTIEEALKAQTGGADYIGVGAIFNTSTKKDANSVTIVSLEEIKKSVNIPVVAIGGINYSNAKEVIGTGIDGIAVVSAILGEENIRDASKELMGLFV
jgi:thiamine-phosphate pyrophosphorylase